MNTNTSIIIAQFHPQAWLNDQAIEVDPQGPTEWDCTADFEALDPEYRALLESGLDAGEVLDHHDLLLDGATAPEWVRAWNGPFSIYVSRALPLSCDMKRGCEQPVGMVDDSGWLYCAPHGAQRDRPCRKLTTAELARLRAGKTIRF